jgi:hypothetical protein
VFPIAAVAYGTGFILLVGMRIQEQEELEYVVGRIEFLLNKLRARMIVSRT